MGAELKLIPADEGHLEYVAAHMREADKEEVWAASRETPLQALITAYSMSEFAWAAVDPEGLPVAVFGVAEVDAPLAPAVPWLLSTGGVKKHWLSFAKHSRSVVRALLTKFPVLENYVDARYKTAVRWIRWMGFTVHEAEPLGVEGVPFHRFTLRRDETWAE